ncbi:MAG: hypothetical protein QOH50_3207 [Kribbellaceae bacterium]|nr:hypothetical protein [Kribbellaceae bacterium]
MSALLIRGVVSVSIVVAVLGATAGCIFQDADKPAAQTPTSSRPPPTLPTAKPSGTPSTDCPETISAVRAAVEKATWGKGASKSPFQPVSVTICEYDDLATGQDYATGTTKRTGAQATALFALLNSAKPEPTEPKVCTKELGPTYVMRFTDNDRGVLSYTAEAYGCRRLVATSFEGRGKPGDLAAPRHVTPALLGSLPQR